MERDRITPIPESIQWRENKFEHSLTYQTTAGQRKELALVHVAGEAMMTFATFAPGQEEPFSSSRVSVEEMKLRKEFFDRLDKMGLLDHS